MPVCPHCRSENEDNAVRCASCGASLSRRLRKKNKQPSFEELPWPRDASDNPIAPAFLQYVPNHQQLQLTRAFLAAFEIPSTIVEPNRNTFSTVLFGGELLGADVYVPETRIEEAQNILNAPYEEPDQTEETAGNTTEDGDRA